MFGPTQVCVVPSAAALQKSGNTVKYFPLPWGPEFDLPTFKLLPVPLFERTYKRLIRRWDTRTWRRSVLLPLLRLTPQTEGFP